MIHLSDMSDLELKEYRDQILKEIQLRKEKKIEDIKQEMHEQQKLVGFCFKSTDYKNLPNIYCQVVSAYGKLESEVTIIRFSPSESLKIGKDFRHKKIPFFYEENVLYNCNFFDSQSVSATFIQKIVDTGKNNNWVAISEKEFYETLNTFYHNRIDNLKSLVQEEKEREI